MFGRHWRKRARHGRQVGRVERARYERFRGDLEGALDLWSDDFVWEGANASDLPGSGRHEGKQAATWVCSAMSLRLVDDRHAAGGVVAAAAIATFIFGRFVA